MTTRKKYTLLIFFLLLVSFLVPGLFYFHVIEQNPVIATVGSLEQKPPSDWQPIRVLTANVGNLSFSCQGSYNNKLCQKSVEEAITKNIQILQPDIIFLQELLHPSQCAGWSESNPNKACYENISGLGPNQARRILGQNYTIICAARMRTEIGHPVGMECIGVNKSVGLIEDCELGELCFTFGGLDVPPDDCNPEFVIMSTIAQVRNLRIGLINAHPNSRNKFCRANSIKQIFEGHSGIPLLEFPQNTIIAGDFNFNPFHDKGNVPESWQDYVGMFGSEKPFYYHSGLAEHNPSYASAYFLFQKKTVDHVVSNFALGTCVTLGEAPNTQRIDDGQGMDHRAIMCNLWIPPNNNP